MRENITFRKICDKNGKVLAALNLNNMIPVRDEYVTEIDLRIHPKDSQELICWKNCVSRSLTGASPIRPRLNDWQMNYIVSIHLTSHLEKERFASIFRH